MAEEIVSKSNIALITKCIDQSLDLVVVVVVVARSLLVCSRGCLLMEGEVFGKRNQMVLSFEVVASTEHMRLLVSGWKFGASGWGARFLPCCKK